MLIPSLGRSVRVEGGSLFLLLEMNVRENVIACLVGLLLACWQAAGDLSLLSSCLLLLLLAKTTKEETDRFLVSSLV